MPDLTGQTATISDVTVCLGSTATFTPQPSATLLAKLGSVQYQWYKGTAASVIGDITTTGQVIGGATGLSYTTVATTTGNGPTTTATTAQNGDRYFLVITPTPGLVPIPLAGASILMPLISLRTPASLPAQRYRQPTQSPCLKWGRVE